MDVQTGGCKKGNKVILIDDLMATGGTMLAAANMHQRLGVQIVEAAAVIDLSDLSDSQR